MRTFISLFGLLPAFVSAQCKDLDVDWGTYTGTLNEATAICKYSNVRFASPPIGELRFQKPRTPSKMDPPAPKEPVSCLQVNLKSDCAPLGGALFESPKCIAPVGFNSEDCLFLDIYVPTAAFNADKPVSVIVWIYGGAYVAGSKDSFDLSQLPFYSGQGILKSTKDPVIFVAGNYRLGAFGWLAGSYVKDHAVPNLGLYDQRKVLEFVKENIGKLNGASSSVSVWGESAGAGSILHHLVAVNGTQDPLFTKAVLQSPAFQWQWNQTGTLNNTYTLFAKLSGCPTGDIKCLQDASSNTLDLANQHLFETGTAYDGIFLLGPAVDGDLITTLPAVALKQGKVWPGISSTIISHVSNEVPAKSGFIPKPIRDNPTPVAFQNFLNDFLPSDKFESIRKKITNRYTELDQKKRTADVIRDSSFTCNTRQLFDAFYGQKKTKLYTMNYNYLNFVVRNYAVHATDLLPTFVNGDINTTDLIDRCIPAGNNDFLKNEITKIATYTQQTFGPAYQSYLKSHALFGDPNTAANGPAQKVTWPEAFLSRLDRNEKIHGVMAPFYPLIKSNVPFRIDKDRINTKSTCDFWATIAEEIMQVAEAEAEAKDAAVAAVAPNVLDHGDEKDKDKDKDEDEHIHWTTKSTDVVPLDL